MPHELHEPHKPRNQTGAASNTTATDTTRATNATAAAAEEEERWFDLSYRDAGVDRVTAFMDQALGAGPGVAGAGVSASAVRIRAGEFRLDIPRSHITGAHRSAENLHGTTGIHHQGRRWLINGGPDGLVKMVVSPAVYTRQQLSSLFRRLPVESVRLSLVDPDGFLDALGFPV